MYHCLVILAKRHRMVKSNCQDFWKQICKCSSAFVIHNIPLTQHIQYAVHSVMSILLSYICFSSHFKRFFPFYVWFLHPFHQNPCKLQFRKSILLILKDELFWGVRDFLLHGYARVLYQNKDRHYFNSLRMPTTSSGMKPRKEMAFNGIGCALWSLFSQGTSQGKLVPLMS